MSASYTLITSRFPDGTAVYANANDYDDQAVSAVMAGGTATFDGLREYEDYTVHGTVSGQVLSVTFTTDGGPNAQGGSVLAWDADAEVYILAPGAREFVGPVDPSTIEGITMAPGDRWTPTEEGA
jgi:hypothetical protein